MKPWLLPSGIQRGIPFIIPNDWSPEQALAVVELLDDLREQIWRHYEVQLYDQIRENNMSSETLEIQAPGTDPPF